MRGSDVRSGSLFSYVDLEERVPRAHPLRVIRAIVNDVLEAMSADFAALYAHTGRPSIPPEQLLRALLLQAFYGVRSERQLIERIRFDLLFRWFVGLGVDEAPWDATSFTRNRERLLGGDVAAAFLAAVLGHAKVKRLVSSDHFSVDGTLIQAWASMKSFRPKDESGADTDDRGGPGAGGGRNRDVDFRGQTRSNDTHESRTDPDARLARKGNGKEARLAFMGHALMENRSGLIVAAVATRASGRAERLAAAELIAPFADRPRRVTLGADKNFDCRDFVEEMRELNVTPHVARNDAPTKTGKRRRSAIDGRTTRHAGYAISQRIRKRIEEPFGWIKTSAGFAQTKLRGLAKVDFQFTFNAAAYNLACLPRLLAPA